VCFCDRGLDAFEFSIVRCSVAFFLSFGAVFLCEVTRCSRVFDCLFSCCFFPDVWELCFARGDSMLLSFRLFAFLLLVLDFRNRVSVRGNSMFLSFRLFICILMCCACERGRF